MDHLQTLGQTFLFKGFPQGELNKLGSAVKEDDVTPGTTLFREGSAGDAFYVVVMGSVQVLKKTKSGSEEPVATLGSGSCFGEMALVTDDHQRTATIVAKEPTKLLLIGRVELEKLCAADASFAHAFYKAVARGLAKRLAATTQDAAFYRTLANQKHL